MTEDFISEVVADPIDPYKNMDEKRASLIKVIKEAINGNSLKNISNFILAEYLVKSLDLLKEAINTRERSYGRGNLTKT